MITRMQHLVTLLLLTTSLLAGCNNTAQHPPIPYRKSDIPTANLNKPPPRGETSDTGYWHYRHLWMGNGLGKIDWWMRTVSFTEYDKIGIPTNFPVDESGKSYIGTNHFPEHLTERLKEVNRKHNYHNNYGNSPEHYQDIYKALCGHLDPKDAVKFFETYNYYNPFVLKHMADYQAFRYTQRTIGIGDMNIVREYAERVFDDQPHTDKGLETGMYLGKYQEVLKYHPKSAETLFRLGSGLSNKQPELAITYLVRADNYEDQARLHETLARTYQKLDDGSNALYHFKESYRLDPLNFEQSYIYDVLRLETGKDWDAGRESVYNAYLFDIDLIYCTAFPDSVKASGIDPQKRYDDTVNRMITYMCEAITLSPKEPVYKDKLQSLLEKREINVRDGLQLHFLILDTP